MITPPLESLKKNVEDSVKLIEWLVAILRSKNWIRKLLLFDSMLIIVLNPIALNYSLKLVSNYELPSWYPLIFWIIVGLIFFVALIIGVRTLPQKGFVSNQTNTERSAIKGLIPFVFEDSTIFARLQRENILNECIQGISDGEFYFGTLTGESGCGKSSLLQAGLWPRILTYKMQCLYVRFTDLDPFESIRLSIVDQLKVPESTITRDNLHYVLSAAIRSRQEPIVFIFDQFEQFFLHNKSKKQRKPFLEMLAYWYSNRQFMPIKLFVCMRSDFNDRLIEMQKVIGFSLGPLQSFRLEKFEPREATEIFKVIAETSGLIFDENFVNEIAEKELASQVDGLISPVDIQVLSWMIVGQSAVQDRAFNRSTYQKLGGIEGLLDLFLSRALDARETESRRQAVVKVLLALIDLQVNARAGVLTLKGIKEKLHEQIAEAELRETLRWLARSDVRLVNLVKREAVEGYEIVHERLIPAVRRLAGKELSRASQANLILERRVNEWLGNNKSSGNLLNWREWRLIEDQKAYIDWGSKRTQKMALLSRTKRYWYLRFFYIATPLIVVTAFLGWWNSPWGQIYQIKQDLMSLGPTLSMDYVKEEIPRALVANGSFRQASQLALGIKNNFYRSSAFRKMAEVAANMGETKQAIIFLNNSIEARRAEGEIDVHRELMEISDIGKRSPTITEDPEYVELVFQLLDSTRSDREKMHLLLSINDFIENKIPTTQCLLLLQKTIHLADSLETSEDKDSAFQAVTEIAAELSYTRRDASSLHQAYQVSERIGKPYEKAKALWAIAEAEARLGSSLRASDLLHKSIEICKGVPDIPSNGRAKLVNIIIDIAGATKDSSYIDRALLILDNIGFTDDEFSALMKMAKVSANIGNQYLAETCFNNGLKTIENMRPSIEYDEFFLLQEQRRFGKVKADDRSVALRVAAKTAIEISGALNDPTFFELAIDISNRITDLHERETTLIEIAQSAAELYEIDQAWNVMQQLIRITQGISSSSVKAEILQVICESIAEQAIASKNAEHLERAINLVQLIDDSEKKAEALCHLAEAVAKGPNASSAVMFLDKAFEICKEEKRKTSARLSHGFVVTSAVRIASYTNDFTLLEKANVIREELLQSDDQGFALNDIAAAAAKMGEIKFAYRIALLSDTDNYKAKALCSILINWSGYDPPLIGTVNDDL